MPAIRRSPHPRQEQPAATESVERYLTPLHAYVLRQVRLLEAMGTIHLGDLSVPALVNETVLTALQQMPRRPSAVSFFHWLRGLARGVVDRAATRVQEEERREVSLETTVARRARPAEGQPLERFRLIDVLPNPRAPIPATVLENRRVQDYLCCMLGQLPESWREPFLLRVVDGYSVEEIATLEGTGVAAVRRAIRQARQWIQAKLAEEYAEPVSRRAWETLIRAAEAAPPPEIDSSPLLSSLERAREASQGLPSSQRYDGMQVAPASTHHNQDGEETMAQQQPMACENPEPLSDVTYDLSTTLSSLGKGAHIIETYIDDAKKANDSAAANVLGQVREGLLCEADRLRDFIKDQMKQGRF